MPTLNWPSLLRWSMPEAELKVVRTAARKLRQATNGIDPMPQDGFDFELLQVRPSRPCISLA